jgi:hypothetical protein
MVQTAVSHRDVAHAGGQPDTGSGNTGAKAWTKRSEKEVVDQVYCSTGTRGQMVQVEGKKNARSFRNKVSKVRSNTRPGFVPQNRGRAARLRGGILPI